MMLVSKVHQPWHGGHFCKLAILSMWDLDRQMACLLLEPQNGERKLISEAKKHLYMRICKQTGENVQIHLGNSSILLLYSFGSDYPKRCSQHWIPLKSRFPWIDWKKQNLLQFDRRFRMSRNFKIFAQFPSFSSAGQFDQTERLQWS